MLGQLFEKHGLKARVLGPEALTENLFGLDATGVALICLSFSSEQATGHPEPRSEAPQTRYDQR